MSTENKLMKMFDNKFYHPYLFFICIGILLVIVGYSSYYIGYYNGRSEMAIIANTMGRVANYHNAILDCDEKGCGIIMQENNFSITYGEVIQCKDVIINGTAMQDCPGYGLFVIPRR